MKYENKIGTNKCDTPTIKGTETAVHDILRLLSEGNSFDEVVRTHPKLSIQDIFACLEYATELVIVYDFKKSTKKINEHFKERHALADRIRALKDKPFIFKDENGNEINLSKM